MKATPLGVTLGALLLLPSLVGAQAPEASAPSPQAATPPPQQAYCIILGAFASTKLAHAQAFVQKLDVPATIYEARAFDTFAWGDLVVVHQRLTEKEATKAAAKALRAKRKGRKKINAYVKPCPLAYKDTLTPIRSAADLTPPPKLEPLEPLEAGDLKLEAGCFAWSPKTRTAACVVGEDDLHGAGRFALAFKGEARGVDEITLWDKAEGAEWVDEPELALDPEILEQLNARLKAEGFKRLPDEDERRTLEAGGLLHWGAPRISARWTRRVEEVDGGAEGSWRRYHDDLELRCGGRKGAWLRLDVPASHESAHEGPEVEMGLIPGGEVLWVTWVDDWSIYIDRGRERRALLIDTQTCRRLGAPPPAPPASLPAPSK